METVSPIPSPEFTSAPPAAAPPPPAAPPMPAPMQSAPMGNPVADFFSGIQITDVLMVGLVGLALFYNIYYCRSMIIQAKTWKTKEQQDIDELKANVKSALGDQYQTYS